MNLLFIQQNMPIFCLIGNNLKNLFWKTGNWPQTIYTNESDILFVTNYVSPKEYVKKKKYYLSDIIVIRTERLLIFKINLIYFPTRVTDTSDTSVTVTQTTRMRIEWEECNASETQATQVRHEYYTNEKSANLLILIMTRVETYYHTHILAIWQMKDYKERSSFILRTNFWKVSHAKMRLKSVPQKLNFAMAEAISKSYTLDCCYKWLCIFRHSYA